jgi:hypothetical protein
MMSAFSARILRLAATAAALGTLVAAPARAQDQQPTEFQSFQLPGWTFTPGVAFGTLFDSNVAIAAPPTPGGSPTSDTLMTIQPYGQLEYFSPRTSFSSGYQGYVRRYFDVSNLDGTDHRAYVNLRERYTRRVTFFLTDNFLQVPTTDELQLNGVPFERTGSRYNALAGGVEARLTPTVDLTARYDMTWVDFLHQTNTYLNSGIVNGLHTDVTRHLTDRFSAGGEYTFRWADLNAATASLTFHEVGALVRYQIAERTTAEVSGGLSHMNDGTRMVSASGPYVRATLTERLSRATVTGDYERSYVPSFTFGGTNQSQQLRGAVQMPLKGNRVYLEEAASWRRTNPFITTELPLDSIWVNTVVGYTVRRWFRIEGYDSYTRQDTRQFGGLVTRNVVGVQLIVAEPVRIR